VSATRTGPMTVDRPTPVRLISEIALIASGAEDPPTPDRPSVLVTQHDPNDRRSARRLPGPRRRPNAEVTRWKVGWEMRMYLSNVAGIRLVTGHGPSLAPCQTL
jgi:hypothetical protein